MNFTYKAYGLVLELPFPCPMLPPAPDGVKPDVTVKEGPVPLLLSAPVYEDQNWQIEPGRFLLRGGLLAGRFLVEYGQQITLERNPRAEDARLAVHFMASVLAVLLQQRGLLVLHANTALTPFGAVAISGASGAGKTTTVAGLLKKGCTLLADDITVLQQKKCGPLVEVIPGAPQLHLCEDTAKLFGYDITALPRYPWRRMKAAVPADEVMANEAAPLHSIYLLTPTVSHELRISALSGVDKFAALQECLYGPLIPKEQSGMFSLHAMVLETIDIFRIERPESSWSLDEIVETILHG